MQQYFSNDDNYLRLSQQSGGSGGSGASAAGPQPYRNSYPLHDTPGTAKAQQMPAALAAAHTMGGPMPYTAAPQQQPRPYVVYPEVRPPPIAGAQTAPPSAFGYAHPTQPAATLWGQVPEAAKHHHSLPYPTLQQQYIPPPAPPAPIPVSAEPLVQSSRPGYYRMPKGSRHARQDSAGRPPHAAAALYPQSAPISPTNGYEPYVPGAARAQTYHPAEVYPVLAPNAQPLSAPAPPAYTPASAMPPPAYAPQVTAPARPSSGSGQTPLQKQHAWAKSPPSSGAHDTSRLQIAYLRNKDRLCERNNFNTLFHCLKPVDLVSKHSVHMVNNREHHRGNLYPLYKVNEDWIAPNVGLPLKNKPGYRCLIYVIDGTLLYDNGISGEKLLSKGTIHMFTTTRDISIYARNPSKTHRAHVMRMWIETEDPPATSSSTSDTAVPVRLLERRPQPGTVVHPDFRGLIRHVADSDKQNCLLVLAQPANYLPSFGMTKRIYGPLVAQPTPRAKDSLADVRSGAASPLESSYCMSQSMMFTRPEYFTPEPVDLESDADDKDWEVTDPQLTSRVCVDPLKVDENIFVSVCQLETGASVIYEPYDLHDRDRAQQRRLADPLRGSHRRVWIQAVMADLNPEASANGGRLVVNGDMVSRMRPGDSAYVRRLGLSETLVIENCGRVPIDFIVVETPY